jgi:DNA repair exonuclease SbcCD ATPase subunit
MSKVIPSNIKSLTEELAVYNKELTELSNRAREVRRSKSEAYREIQRLCRLNRHKFTDGTSAWKEYYAYGGCEICGENDL